MVRYQILCSKPQDPDGFRTTFYQHMWGTVGENLFDLVKHAYLPGRLSEGLNDNHFVLIPKVKSS